MSRSVSNLARDEHGPIKAGVTFERSAAELAALEYRQAARQICPECVAKDAALAAKDDVIRQLGERLAAASECLGRAAERRARKAEPFMPPPEMTKP